MRHILITAAFAAGAILANTAAKAQVPYQAGTQILYEAGGQVQIGSMCRVNTDTADGGAQLDRYGYYTLCGYGVLAQAPAPRYRR